MTPDLDLARLARLGALVAGDLERRGYPMAGIVRQIARALVTVSPARDTGCRGCGAPLTTGRGRPRIWCSERCRRQQRL